MSIYYVEEDNLSEHLRNPDIPNVCPVCKYTIFPECLLVSDKEYDRETGIVIKEVVFKCTNTQCASLFIGEYECLGHQSLICATIPKLVENVKVSEAIEEISPEFVSIYTQAIQSEKLGLDSICGVGYRKAIEFLVKDYLKSTDNDEYTHEQVESTSLRNCITQWIKDPKIKAVLERATILGNDETHYKRKFIDKDIHDLKLLIELTLHYIDMDLTFKKIEETFPLKSI
ncbi:DUF4145 domain-containing protein [Virgibacillus halodenitrificans]|uniref:DUF4145 domain-containing protein n=1 Tax=Virgibacillus halodenitrificans TaxID=1482 RepID=A0ABR7VSF0_VIRHA|nr:DUF4145 domain-containing protein [Virgibacillus halodenitrificans]MBD1224804.1 DUF4145 domain-containing protein [Virgibacillus halodenitrificans]